MLYHEGMSTESRENWQLVSLATIGSVEAALLLTEDGKRVTVLSTPGLIARVQSGEDATQAILGTTSDLRPVEELVGWPEDWNGDVEESIVEAYARDTQGH